MLLKRILSLSLAAGLAIGASANVFAWDGESELDTFSNTTENNKEFMCDAVEMLVIHACAWEIFHILSVVDSPDVQCFCGQLSSQLNSGQDTSNLKTEFKCLCKNNVECRKAVKDALGEDVETGSKQHASVQDGINKRSSKIHKRSSKIQKRSSKAN